MTHRLVAFFTISSMLAIQIDMAASAVLSDCYHSFLTRSSSPSTCQSSSDCLQEGAACVFSLTAKAHVCCVLRHGAIAPTCPPGTSSASALLPIFCDPANVNGADVDVCPAGYACVESSYESSGQVPFICCRTN